MSFTWQDAKEIASELLTEYPDINPLDVPFNELYDYVINLPDFADDPEDSNEEILESIRDAWNEEYLDNVD